MTFDLRDIPMVIAALPSSEDGGLLATELADIGVTASVVAAATGANQNRARAETYGAAFDSIDKLPFGICDGDRQVVGDLTSLPELPSDADVVFLGVTNAGCLPDTAYNRTTFRVHRYDGMALAQRHSDSYDRVYNMVGPFAFLVVSARGRDLLRTELRKAFNRKMAPDVRVAFALSQLNAYALRTPVIAGRDEVSSGARAAGLPLAQDDLIREVDGEVWRLRVQAGRKGDKGPLFWQVLQAESVKLGHVFRPAIAAPALQQQPKLPSYNSDILKDRINIHDWATVIPPDGKYQSCGVVTADGQFDPLSREFKYPKKPNPVPEQERISADTPVLKGTYVYGGWMHPHFGHFLAESTGRLWGLGQYDGTIDGIIMIPIGPGSLWRAFKSNRALLTLLSDDVPVLPKREPVVVERLIVPEQGFGHQNRMQGSDAYVAWVQAQVGKRISPSGSDKLYISRSALADKKGKAFGEELIEACLEANGYEIFHPQKHPIEEQLARYRAAKRIVGFDGSALHCVALALGSDAKVAILPRRSDAMPDRIAAQLTRFTGAEVVVLDAILRLWVNEGTDRIDYSTQSELDLGRLGQMLKTEGFISDASMLQTLTPAQIADYIDQRDDGLPALVPYGQQ